jgi:outer membrane protein assembly factor BamB
MNWKFIVALAILLILAAGVPVRKYIRSLRCRPPVLTVIDDRTLLDDAHLELSEHEPESWVRRFKPDRSSSGYNLALFHRRVPLIIDMNGRVVHAWPEVRATGRVRLNQDGSLAVIGADNLVKEYSWDGELLWHFQLDDIHDLPHHDLIRLENENYLVLVHDGHGHADYLLEIDRSGDVVWEWWIQDHAERFPTWDPNSTDPSHSNSIYEIPANRWFEAGDDRFRPGNILVSARTLNTIFIIDRSSGEIVWTYSKGFDGQHEAVMLERPLRGAGLIMVFNNGLTNLNTYRRSTVETINPVSGTLEWHYGSENFYSSVGGTAQPLSGNNVLITSSRGGRVFEITSRGRIVWEWVPPYPPMRVERVAYDHCPQLAGRPRPPENEVVPKQRRPHVDADLYRFDFRWQTEKRLVGDRARRIIPSNSGCREIRIPPGATLRAEYGIDGGRLAGRPIDASFRLWIEDHPEPPVVLVDDNLDETATPLWRSARASLAAYALRQVTLCLETHVSGDFEGAADVAYWVNPLIRSKEERMSRAERSRPVSEQERELREQQLRAFGYVH